MSRWGRCLQVKSQKSKVKSQKSKAKSQKSKVQRQKEEGNAEGDLHTGLCGQTRGLPEGRLLRPKRKRRLLERLDLEAQIGGRRGMRQRADGYVIRPCRRQLRDSR